MSLMEFARLVVGFGIGFIVTVVVFVIGHAVMEITLFGEEPNVFFILMAMLFWLMISYGVIVLIL